MLVDRRDDGAFVLLICERHTSPSEDDVSGLDFLHVYDSAVSTKVGGNAMAKAVTVWVMGRRTPQVLTEGLPHEYARRGHRPG